MNFSQPRKGEMEVLSKQQMKEIAGGDAPISHLGFCAIQCDGGGSFSTSSCNQDDADVICQIYMGEYSFATHCECQYVD